MSRRDMGICRLRREEGLSCHSCRYCDECKEYRERRIGVPKTPKQPRSYRWTPEEAAVCMDPKNTIQDVARLTGKTRDQVYNYRHYHGFARKYTKKDKSE